MSVLACVICTGAHTFLARKGTKKKLIFGRFADLFVSLCPKPKDMRKLVLFFVCLLSLSVSGQRRSNRQTSTIDIQSVHAQQYADSLQQLIDNFRHTEEVAQSSVRSVTMNPYYFPIISGAILYKNPLQQSLGIKWTPSSLIVRKAALSLAGVDEQLLATENINSQLSSMYAKYPNLFTQTQDQMMEEGALVTDIKAPIKSDTRIAEQIKLTDIDHKVTDNVAAITRRPNFWTVKGSMSLQFTQSYFSDNWFQGGDNNYAALSMFTIEANYDNKQKLQWENKLEAQLGFQTTKGDTCHSMKVTSNLLRYTTKVGYKAFKNWFYTARFQANTQLYPNYKTNSDQFTTRFASPLYLSFSLGMDFKWNLKRFSGSLYMAPVEVNARYVSDEDLRANYNDGPDQVTKWTWGPNVVVNYKWKMWDNVEWQSRMYWFSNFNYTNVEWENTFTFSVNKYLNCKLFVYPKFIDDKRYGSNEVKNDPDYSYWMLKEYLMLGLSYSW